MDWKMPKNGLWKYAPFYDPAEFSEEAEWALAPFVTDLYAPVYSFRTHLLPPQLLGALFSRASRAKGDLREVFWNEYLKPILYPQDDESEALETSAELRQIIEFHYDHPTPPYNTKRAHRFFARWLAQYGDDSIAQMASTNLVVVGLSQPAIKFLEDQRIGVAPIEKSTRYVDYGGKINGRYLYHMDPHIADWGLEDEYRAVMDALFGAYSENIPILVSRLQEEYPDENESALEKKAFDVLRGFLPMATLSQVAFHGNAQAFKYMIDRCAKHPRGELRWFARAARKALDEEIPAMLLRLDDEPTHKYQRELVSRRRRVARIAEREFGADSPSHCYTEPQVYLVDYDPEGEEKIIAALLFAECDSTTSWDEILNRVRTWDEHQRKEVLDAHFRGRTTRWQKVGRPFENAFVRFEIVMNAGAYRDLHRHRMHTQERQRFTTHLGYETPYDIRRFGLEKVLTNLMERTRVLFLKIEEHDPEIAQDVVTMFHFMRFYQYQNIRQFFWETELRTIPQGRPDYRWIEQEKFRLLQRVYPLLCEYILIDMESYDLARRGQEERSQRKEEELKDKL